MISIVIYTPCKTAMRQPKESIKGNPYKKQINNAQKKTNQRKVARRHGKIIQRKSRDHCKSRVVFSL